MIDQTLLVIFGMSGLLGGIILGIFAMIKTESIIPFIFGTAIGMVIFGSFWNVDVQQQNDMMDKRLVQFEKLDCDDQADWILKNYIDGNKTISSKAIIKFNDAGCKFDIGTAQVLGDDNP